METVLEGDREVLKRNGLLGPKLELAVFVFLSPGEHFAASYASHPFEDPRAHFVDGFGAVDHATG